MRTIQNLLKRSWGPAALLCASGVFLFSYSAANAATLQINSAATTLAPGDTATLQVVVNTGGVAINNAEARIAFPTDVLEVLSINKTGSVFQLWVEEPSFSNSAGIITFNGGVPTPGYTGTQGLVVSVVVRAKKAGQAELVFSNTAVRANDGQGTNVLNSQYGRTLAVVESVTVPTVVPTVPVASNLAMQVSSVSHPGQSQWFNKNAAVVQWAVPAGADAVQTLLSATEGATPTIIYSPPISEKTIEDLEDGVWYFNVRARTAAGWGPVTSYRLQVDTTPPVLADIRVQYSVESKALMLQAAVAQARESAQGALALRALITDAVSGVATIEVLINDESVSTIPFSEVEGDTYTIPVNLDSGTYEVSIRVSDQAGNSTESSPTRIEVEAESASASRQIVFTIPVVDPLVLLLALSLALSVISIFINIVLWRKVRRYQRRTPESRRKK